MKFGIDIGGVISKYPDQFKDLIYSLVEDGHEVFIITDMHPRHDVMTTLANNGMAWFDEGYLLIADYETHGEMAKALLCRDHEIDFLIDDFPGYLQWDSSFGPAPIRLQVMPDPFRPYWHPTWKCEGGEFGRRVYSKPDGV